LYRTPRNFGKYYSFPSNIPISDQDKQATASALGCTESLGYFADLLATLLQGTDVKLREWLLHLSALPGPVAQSAMWPEAKSHAVFEVYSHSGKYSWVIDLSGPQYGIFAPCMRWNNYTYTYKTSLKDSADIGSRKMRYETQDRE
jgi:hypothetical protein